MLLALDIGNSQTSFGIFENQRLLHHWTGETKPSRTSDEYAAFLFPLLENAGIEKKQITGVALCSVVPPADQSFLLFSQQYLGHAPYKVEGRGKLSFPLNVDVPEEVGADRIANAAYSLRHLALPAIVVDIGTATTFDVMGGAGAYEGGVILPGLRMGVEGLGTKTAKLPLVELAFPKRVIGKNTIECIRGGLLFGYCDLLDGLLSRTIEELGKKPTIALTGGLSFLFQGKLRHSTVHLPHLTLEGVRILYESQNAR